MTIRWSRREALAGGAAAVALTHGIARAAQPRRQPNILFILADDLGYADLSCYGRTDYRTPALDRLAMEGMRFTDAYANSAVCSATRTALITGRYQYRLPIGLEEPLNGRDVGLDPAVPTLPSLLRKAGYQTALVGKWHLGELPRYGPLQSGYDHFWGFRRGGIDYFTHALAGHDLWDDDVEVHRTGYLTDLLGDRAIGMLESFAAKPQPFLMSLHFSAPHWPWEGPDDKPESDRLAKAGGPLALFDFDGGTLATYAAIVTRMDYQIGRVLDRLKKLGLADDTIVVFTSDNGGERFSATWPFSGRKGELLEGGLRIPAIVRWPGHVKPGSTSAAQIMSMDWMPTFLAAAGGAADPSAPSDGVHLAPALGGGTLAQRPLFWRYKANTQQAMRLGDWKYLKIRENSFLFNVAADPLERANLKDRYPDRYAALTEQWRRWDAAMLPLDPKSFTGAASGRFFPDRMATDDMGAKMAPGKPQDHP